MALSWKPKDDFSQVVDLLEPVTLLRRGSSTQVAIATAWRFSHQKSESEKANGHAPQTDVEWQFPWDTALSPPQLGDRLLDAAGDCWTLLEIESLRGETRWRCQARNLRLAHRLDALLKVEQAVWEDLGSGPEITGWTLFRESVYGNVQPETTTVDEQATPLRSTATYRVVLEESLAIDHNHRFVDSDGNIYRLLRLEQTDRIDVLPVATVRREATA